MTMRLRKITQSAHIPQRNEKKNQNPKKKYENNEKKVPIDNYLTYLPLLLYCITRPMSIAGLEFHFNNRSALANYVSWHQTTVAYSIANLIIRPRHFLSRV